MQKKISVILPIYNGELFLTDAIESVLNQDYENIELILINDGSTDSSQDIINRYRIDPRVRIISRENKGLVYSLNEGINAATGSYIARMDADDISLPSRLRKQVAFLECNTLDVVGSWVELFNSSSDSSILTYPELHNDNIFGLFFYSTFAHPSVLFKREVFRNLSYNEIEIAEDYNLWCEIILSGFKVGNVQEVLLKYREHDQQITSNKMDALNISSNRIRALFASNYKLLSLVQNEIDIQQNNSYKKFSLLLTLIKEASFNLNVSKHYLDEILRRVYLGASPKSPLIYLIYLSYLSKWKLKRESILFINSFLIFRRGSKMYKLLTRFLK
jgi:glycosyltransferase involved in cell wall biosynthesis